MDIDECESDPCLNKGVCINLVNAFTCRCDDGFTGDAVVLPNMPNIILTRDYYVTGEHCSTEINECESNPCENGGTCKDAVALFRWV